jgi:hypothetical protein
MLSPSPALSAESAPFGATPRAASGARGWSGHAGVELPGLAARDAERLPGLEDEAATLARWAGGGRVVTLEELRVETERVA